MPALRWSLPSRQLRTDPAVNGIGERMAVAQTQVAIESRFPGLQLLGLVNEVLCDIEVHSWAFHRGCD